MDVLDISSDEDLSVEATAGGSDDDENYDWMKEVLGSLDSHVDDDDDVVVIKEVLAPPRKRRNCSQNDNDDDCVVLDGDPDKPNSLNQSPGTGQEQNLDLGGESDDLVIVGERGQVACRDYPHSRHLCVRFPFTSTLHVDHCNMCHCYVCDSPAPCDDWGTGISPGDHCHAFDKAEFWRHERKKIKTAKTADLNSEWAPLVNKSQELSTQVQGPTLHPVPNTTHSVSDPLAEKVQELSWLLQGPTVMSAPTSTHPVQMPHLVNKAQQPSTQVQGSTLRVQRPCLVYRSQQFSTQVRGPTLPSPANSSQPGQSPCFVYQAQPSSAQLRGPILPSAPDSTQPAQFCHSLVSAHQLIGRSRTLRLTPVPDKIHRHHPHLVSRHLSRSQSDHYQQTGARFLRTASSVPLLRKHQPGYKDANHHSGVQPFSDILLDTPRSTLAHPHGSLDPSVSMGQDLGPEPSTDQDMSNVPLQLGLQPMVQQPTSLADATSQTVADAGSLLSSAQSSNHDQLLNSHASVDSKTMFPTMQSNSLFDSSVNLVYSPDYNYDQILDNCFDRSMNHQNAHPPYSLDCPSSSPGPVDTSWPYHDVERTWNELSHS